MVNRKLTREPGACRRSNAGLSADQAGAERELWQRSQDPARHRARFPAPGGPIVRFPRRRSGLPAKAPGALRGKVKRTPVLALIGARRGIAMYRRVDVPVLGLIESMSYFLCSHCGKCTDIFSHGGAKAAAEKTGVAFLGEVPLDAEIRETSDSGLPVVATRPDSPHTQVCRVIAKRVGAELERANGRKSSTQDRHRKLIGIARRPCRTGARIRHSPLGNCRKPRRS